MVIEGKPEQRMRRVASKKFWNDAPSKSGATDARVTMARSLGFNLAQLAKTHPVRKCVTGLIGFGWFLDFYHHIAVFNLDVIHGQL